MAWPATLVREPSPVAASADDVVDGVQPWELFREVDVRVLVHLRDVREHDVDEDGGAVAVVGLEGGAHGHAKPALRRAKGSAARTDLRPTVGAVGNEVVDADGQRRGNVVAACGSGKAGNPRVSHELCDRDAVVSEIVGDGMLHQRLECAVLERPLGIQHVVDEHVPLSGDARIGRHLGDGLGQCRRVLVADDFSERPCDVGPLLDNLGTREQLVVLLNALHESEAMDRLGVVMLERHAKEGVAEVGIRLFGLVVFGGVRI